MQSGEFQARRTVIPIWRSWRDTPIDELSGAPKAKQKSKQEAGQAVLLAAIRAWRKTRTLQNAEAVADAVTLAGGHPEAEAALQQVADGIVSTKTGTARLLSPEMNSLSDRPHRTDGAVENIRLLKRRLQEQPADTLNRVELAREYLALGQRDKAIRAMEIAIGGSPNSRYVIRCATRLFAHSADPERALSVIRSTEIVRTDPWVMAAEVAVADLLGRTPRWGTRFVSQLASAKNLGRQHSELASALGTLEASAGSNKRAKRLMVRSLDNPTANSLAQAAWMQSNAFIGDDILPPSLAENNAHEANMLNACSVMEYEVAVENGRSWLKVEPFSLRASIHSSFVCTAFLNDYKSAIEFCDEGMIANPDDSSLKNNKILALIKLGELSEALPLLPKIRVDNLNSRSVYSYALHGLFHYAVGDYQRGQELYKLAIETANKVDRTLSIQAFMTMFEQEVIAGHLSREDVLQTVSKVDEVMRRRFRSSRQVQY